MLGYIDGIGVSVVRAAVVFILVAWVLSLCLAFSVRLADCVLFCVPFYRRNATTLQKTG